MVTDDDDDYHVLTAIGTCTVPTGEFWVLQYSKKGPGVRHFMDIKDERVPQHLRAENTRTFPNAL